MTDPKFLQYDLIDYLKKLNKDREIVAKQNNDKIIVSKIKMASKAGWRKIRRKLNEK